MRGSLAPPHPNSIYQLHISSYRPPTNTYCAVYKIIQVVRLCVTYTSCPGTFSRATCLTRAYCMGNLHLRTYASLNTFISWSLIDYSSAVILVFRTWAIWGRNSKLAIGLLALLHILAIPTAFFAHIGLGHVECTPSSSNLSQTQN